MKTRTALYPGSFDPFTNGHLDILRAALGLADRIVVAIGVHPSKTPMLTAEERVALIEITARALHEESGTVIEVRTFDTLLIDFAAECDASLLIRGLRDGTDLDYEMQMAGMNRTLAPDLQTVFLPARPEDRHITATLVRQIARMGGDISAFVPEHVLDAVKAKLV